MKTLTTPVSNSSGPTRRHVGTVVLGVLLALALGVLGGWWMANATRSDPRIVRVGGGSPTARQEQMVDLVRRYNEAWRLQDAATVASFFTSDGTFVTKQVTRRVDDGSLAAYVGVGDYSTLKVVGPYLVDDDELTVTSKLNASTWVNVFQFTTSGGELKITHHISSYA